jgi:NADH:ubiquinone oxidoreductase subunit 5 (subunit L)/multisubunit Na+/H+ antiporter MnhA subunit
MDSSQIMLVFVVLAPGVVFGVLALLWLVGWVPSERVVSRVTGVTFSASIVALASIFWRLAATGTPSVLAIFGNWFMVHEYHFPLVLLADRLSLPFLGMTVLLAGLIGQFSATYLHRERGFLRFFLLLHLFAFGSLLAFAAGSFDLLVGGWEIVGITSVLLIAFFQQRTAPVENGLRVFAVYRACDIGLLVGVVAMHNWAGTASFAAGLPALSGSRVTSVCLLLLLAAAGKAAQIPFSGWLPRAMEGPTPSSAIFYGAISIHAGAYLLLRVQPMMA